MLLTFKVDNKELSFLDDEERKEISSYLALDLRPTDYKNLYTFFSKEEGKTKLILQRNM